jgi:hypothetical protein
LEVPLADLVAKGVHPEEYASTPKDRSRTKEYAFGYPWRFGRNRTLALVIAHKEKAHEIAHQERNTHNLD